MKNITSSLSSSIHFLVQSCFAFTSVFSSPAATLLRYSVALRIQFDSLTEWFPPLLKCKHFDFSESSSSFLCHNRRISEELMKAGKLRFVRVVLGEDEPLRSLGNSECSTVCHLRKPRSRSSRLITHNISLFFVFSFNLHSRLNLVWLQLESF